MIEFKTSHEEGVGSIEGNVVTINKGMSVDDAEKLINKALDEHDGPVSARGCFPPAQALVMRCLRERGREDEWAKTVH
jgi:hypothetical protein